MNYELRLLTTSRFLFCEKFTMRCGLLLLWPSSMVGLSGTGG